MFYPLSAKVGMMLVESQEIRQIVHHLESNQSLMPFLRQKRIEETRKRSLLETLTLYHVLSDEQFNFLYDKLESSILKHQITDLQDLGRGLDLMCEFDSYEIHKLPVCLQPEVEAVLSEIFRSLSSADEVEKAKKAFLRGLSGSLMDHALKHKLEDTLNALANERIKEVPNKMQAVLRDLNDKNVHDLMSLDQEATPNSENTYQFTAVFEYESSDAIFESLRNMHNNGRNSFNDFLRRHYNLGRDWTDRDSERYQPDMRFIKELKEKADAHVRTIDIGLSRFSYQNLANTLNRILQTYTLK